MKALISVAILAVVLLTGPSFATNDLYSARAKFCYWRLQQAVEHSQCPTAEKLRVHFGKEVFPRVIRVKVENPRLDIILQDSGKFDRFFCECKYTDRTTVPDILVSDPVASDISPAILAGLDRKSVGRLAARLGFDAAYCDGRLTLRKKFFRQGMNDEQFQAAFRATLAHDIPNIDLEACFTGTTRDYVHSMNNFWLDIRALPMFMERVFNIAEFPLPIQQQIRNTIEMYRQSRRWCSLYMAKSTL